MNYTIHAINRSPKLWTVVSLCFRLWCSQPVALKKNIYI